MSEEMDEDVLPYQRIIETRLLRRMIEWRKTNSAAWRNEEEFIRDFAKSRGLDIGSDK